MTRGHGGLRVSFTNVRRNLERSCSDCRRLGARVAARGIGWRGAIAQTKKLVITTMPGPRWEGALKASAKAYMAKHPDVDDRYLWSRPMPSTISVSAPASSRTRKRLRRSPLRSGADRPVLSKARATDRICSISDPEWRDYYQKGVPYFYRGSWDWEKVPYSVVHDANCMMTWWRTDVFDELGLAEPGFLRGRSWRMPRSSTRNKAKSRLHDLRRTHAMVPRHDIHRHAPCLRRPLVRERRDGGFRAHRSEQAAPARCCSIRPEVVAAAKMLKDLVSRLERGFAECSGVRERRGLQERCLPSAS